MEKWKIAAIVALLAALPVYGYFVDGAKKLNSSATSTPTSQPDSAVKAASPPPPYLQNWVGKKPPTFSFPKELWTNTDKPVKVEDFHGSVVLLELWRAGCQHCQEAAPIIERLAEHNKDQGLKVISVHCSADKNSIEYDWNAVKQKLPQMGIEYPVAFDEKRTVFDKFNAKKFPTIIIIDRQGIIRYAHEGMTNPLRIELEAALKKILEGKNPTWPPSKEPTEDAAVKYAPDKN